MYYQIKFYQAEHHDNHSKVECRLWHNLPIRLPYTTEKGKAKALFETIVKGIVESNPMNKRIAHEEQSIEQLQHVSCLRRWLYQDIYECYDSGMVRLPDMMVELWVSPFKPT